MTPTEATLVARGRSCRVYDAGEGRVVKVFENDWPDARIDEEIREAEEAFDLGITPIQCHGRTSVDGQRGAVFDRLSGRALTEVAERNPLRLRAVARQLAGAHVRMHAVHTDGFTDVRELAVQQLHTAAFEDATQAEREQIAVHLRALPEGRSVLHLDFHPQNVFEHNGATAIIDWQTAGRGFAAADVAMSRLLMTEAELFPGISPVQRVVFGAARTVMRDFYLREYYRQTGITAADLDEWDVLVRVLRMGQQNIASEHERLLTGIRTRLVSQ